MPSRRTDIGGLLVVAAILLILLLINVYAASLILRGVADTYSVEYDNVSTAEMRALGEPATWGVLLAWITDTVGCFGLAGIAAAGKDRGLTRVFVTLGVLAFLAGCCIVGAPLMMRWRAT